MQKRTKKCNECGNTIWEQEISDRIFEATGKMVLVWKCTNCNHKDKITTRKSTSKKELIWDEFLALYDAHSTTTACLFSWHKEQFFTKIKGPRNRNKTLWDYNYHLKGFKKELGLS